MYVVHVHLPLNNVGHNHCYNAHVQVFFSSEGKGNLVGEAKAKLNVLYRRMKPNWISQEMGRGALYMYM